jgi:murein DD-endopeptidase MepM/ murein hydrolase activator NlpD
MHPLLNMRAVFVGVALIFSIIFSQNGLVFAQTATSTGDTLRTLIEKKADELKQIEEQKSVVTKSLNTVLESKNSLSKELKVLDSNINQLNLSIKANKINIEKLGLEINDLYDEIESLKEGIQNQKITITKLFVSLQERDQDSLLDMVLRNDRLSESVSEIQSIASLNSALTNQLKKLRDMQQELADRLTNTKDKKQESEQERTTLASRQYIVQDQKQEKQKLLVETQSKEKVYQTQLTELENLQAEISNEIEQIESVLRKNIDPNLLPMPRKGVLLNPVEGSRITQVYGSTPFALRNYKSGHHNGIDLGGVAIGTEVLSAEEGTVISSGDQDKYCPKAAYGKFVVVKHTNGLSTLYAHLSRINVKIGEKVNRGNIIGYLGRTGFATGPHLHFTVFASQTLTPAQPGLFEGTQKSRCGPMPVGGDMDPKNYL